MANFLRRLMAAPPATASVELQALRERVEQLGRDFHKRLMELEASEALREAAHLSRLDKLARLYKRVSQRFVDSPDTNPPPDVDKSAVSVLELRKRLRR